MSKGKGIGKDPMPFPLPVGGKRMEVATMPDTQMKKLLAAQERALQQKHEADRKDPDQHEGRYFPLFPMIVA